MIKHKNWQWCILGFRSGDVMWHYHYHFKFFRSQKSGDVMTSTEWGWIHHWSSGDDFALIGDLWPNSFYTAFVKSLWSIELWSLGFLYTMYCISPTEDGSPVIVCVINLYSVRRTGFLLSHSGRCLMFEDTLICPLVNFLLNVDPQ